MKRAFLYLVSLPADIIAWLILLIVWALWGHQLQWRHGVLCCELKPDSWPQRTWYAAWGGTTFGHSIMFAKGHLEHPPIWVHELVHVEQFEAACVLNAMFFVVWSLGGLWWAGLIASALMPFANVLAAYITGWLRGEGFYAGSNLEEAARATASCRKHNIEV